MPLYLSARVVPHDAEIGTPFFVISWEGVYTYMAKLVAGLMRGTRLANQSSMWVGAWAC